MPFAAITAVMAVDSVWRIWDAVKEVDSMERRRKLARELMRKKD